VASKQKKQQPKASNNEITKLFATALGHHQSGRHAEANMLYERILSIDPKHSDSLHLAGMVAYASGDLAKAHELIGAAVKLQPRADIYLGNFGNVLRASGRLDEAIAVYKKAIASNPKNPTPFSNLGNAYSDLGRLDDAIEQYQKALALKPDFYETLFNLALTLRSVCRFDEAIACLRKATALYPHLAEAHYTLGQTLLLHGDLADGWREYDWRWKLDEYKWLKDIHGEFVQPRWEGESLVGKTLLVYAEQGMGDALQFCRYLPKIVAQGAHVVFAVHPRLMRVIGPMDGVRSVPLDGVPLPPFDFHSPLLSIPRVMGTLRIEDIPGDTPYLKAEPERVARWREKLATISGFKIGIAWQGNPNAKIDKGRSPPLSAFAPLAAIPGVSLVSLQQRDGLDQLEQLPAMVKIHTLGPGVDDEGAFADTAAVMECLDLLILSDSAIVHLAGALRRPVWVPLKRVPDWRFLLKREDTPWYPEMKLFRQSQDGDWSGVFERMAAALRQRLGVHQVVAAVPPAPTFERDFTRLAAVIASVEDLRPPPQESELDAAIVAQMLERMKGEGVIHSGQRALEAGWTAGHGAERLCDMGLKVECLRCTKETPVPDRAVRVLAYAAMTSLPDARFDLIWSRQILQQSLMPYPTLCEYRRVLKPGGHAYFEVPAPDTARQHQAADGNFSVLGQTQWISLFLRAGFTVVWAVGLNYPVAEGKDVYWAFLLRT
jgi:Flp pilus assembly protein TadD